MTAEVQSQPTYTWTRDMDAKNMSRKVVKSSTWFTAPPKNHQNKSKPQTTRLLRTPSPNSPPLPPQQLPPHPPPLPPLPPPPPPPPSPPPQPPPLPLPLPRRCDPHPRRGRGRAGPWPLGLRKAVGFCGSEKMVPKKSGKLVVESWEVKDTWVPKICKNLCWLKNFDPQLRLCLVEGSRWLVRLCGPPAVFELRSQVGDRAPKTKTTAHFLFFGTSRSGSVSMKSHQQN